MEPTHSSPRTGSRSSLDNKFQFISIQNPDESFSREIRRKARSHAIKLSWLNKRRTQHGHQDATTARQSFSDTLVSPPHQGTHQESVSPLDTVTLSSEAVDPFQASGTQGRHGPRFHTFLGNFAAIQATEPVFSVRDPVVFQTFHSVFRTGLEDAALVNAVMLTFAFAAMGGSQLDQETLGYQSKAISSLRQKITSVEHVSALEVLPTIGAILLLTGVEARLGEKDKVEIHMRGVKQLLDACQAKGVYLTDGIKRAIFWQDLNSAVMAGSRRMFSHTTMTEMRWTRDIVSYPNWFTLPLGFETLRHLLLRDFVEAIEDVHALQHMRDSPSFICQDTVAMFHIDNHQAWAQSRLQRFTIQHQEEEGATPPAAVVECCYYAVYLSSTALCCKVWRRSPIPTHLSAELIQRLHRTADDGTWDQYSDLLTWMLCLGGTFSATDLIRDEYVALLNKVLPADYKPWEDLVRVLRQFIWSERAYGHTVKAFYCEIYNKS